MPFTPCADHEVLARWSFDPSTRGYSRRCARCGVVVGTWTADGIDQALEAGHAVPLSVLAHAKKPHKVS
jgi:hypothetical protein